MKTRHFRNNILLDLGIILISLLGSAGTVYAENIAESVNSSETSDSGNMNDVVSETASEEQRTNIVENAGVIDEENSVSWHDVLSEAAEYITGNTASENTDLDGELIHLLGFDASMNALESTADKIVMCSQDKLLDVLLDQYQNYHQQSRISKGYLGEDEFSSLSRDARVTADERAMIIQTMLPLYIQHAAVDGDVISVRKYREMQKTFERLWPNRRLNIACQHNDSAIRLSLASIIPGAHLSGDMIDSVVGFSADSIPGDTSCSVGADVICHALVGRDLGADIAEQINAALDESLLALKNKDNALTADAMGLLCDALDAFYGKYHLNASWNRHWENAPWKLWLCELHTISLMLLEQHRFAELSRLERSIQHVFYGATFYQRIENGCSGEISKNYAEELARLESANGSSYHWIKKQMAPKNRKKLDKAFAAWTKKTKGDLQLSRRLIAAWALWSEGDYARAAQFAGDVAAQKSRLVHPQLHSFDVMLKAVRGEAILQEDMETYVRVVHLKSPWLVYQTLSEAGKWFTSSQRMMAVNVMRQYYPGDASAFAAQFYREYEKELRFGQSLQKLSETDAWMESELRRSESIYAANFRRIQWLEDLMGLEDWKGIVRLSELGESDAASVEWSTFWHAVGCNAHAVMNEGEVCGDQPELLAKLGRMPDAVDPAQWIHQAVACLKK